MGVNAGQVVSDPAIAGGRIGVIGHPVGAHAPGEIQRLREPALLLPSGSRAAARLQVPAGALSRLHRLLGYAVAAYLDRGKLSLAVRVGEAGHTM
jgi:hypothetical protein